MGLCTTGGDAPPRSGARARGWSTGKTSTIRDYDRFVNTARLHIGRSYDVYEGRVDADAAMAFALATNDPNDMHTSGRAVPPLFTVSLILPAYTEAQRLSADPGAIREVRGGMAAGHDVYLVKPLRPGM